MAAMAGALMVKGREAQQVELVAMGAAQDPRAFLNLPWVEAIEEFKARGVISDDEFSRLISQYAEESVEARRLLLERIQTRVRELLVKAVEEGETFEDFAAALADEAPGLGITAQDPSYLDTVFRTNVQSAYGGGRVRALLDPDVQAERQWVQYRTAGDSRVRDSHKLLDGGIYRIDDPEWLKIAPPNGYRCRCSIVSLTQEDVDAEVASGSGEIKSKVPKLAEQEIEGEGFLGPPIAEA